MDEQIFEETRHEAEELMKQHRLQEAVPLIRQLAHWGDLRSQKELAKLLLEGEPGYPANPHEAFEYVRLAALNGDAPSQLQLGRMFLEGLGTDKDLAKAFYFLDKAAQAGEKEAYDPLSLRYLMGQGVARDLEKAAYWNEKAAEAFPEDEDVARHGAMIENYGKRN